jgi:hypothetical protein
MFQTKLVDKTKTHILCLITFFRKSCRLWHNVEKYGTARQGTDDNIIRRMRFACWIIEATDTHSEYVTHCFPRQQWLRERPSFLRLCVRCLYSFFSTFDLNNFLHINVTQSVVKVHTSPHIKCNMWTAVSSIPQYKVLWQSVQTFDIWLVRADGLILTSPRVKTRRQDIGLYRTTTAQCLIRRCRERCDGM